MRRLKQALVASRESVAKPERMTDEVLHAPDMACAYFGPERLVFATGETADCCVVGMTMVKRLLWSK